MTFDLPGSMTRPTVNEDVPSKLTNEAETKACAVPRFWMISGTSYPKNLRVTLGTYTFVAPPVKPL